jgi:hypothetical protein
MTRDNGTSGSSTRGLAQVNWHLLLSYGPSNLLHLHGRASGSCLAPKHGPDTGEHITLRVVSLEGGTTGQGGVNSDLNRTPRLTAGFFSNLLEAPHHGQPTYIDDYYRSHKVSLQ